MLLCSFCHVNYDCLNCVIGILPRNWSLQHRTQFFICCKLFPLLMMFSSLTISTYDSQGETFISKFVSPSSVLPHFFFLCLLGISSSRKAASSVEGVKYITPEKSEPDLKAVPVKLNLILAMLSIQRISLSVQTMLRAFWEKGFQFKIPSLRSTRWRMRPTSYSKVVNSLYF